MFRALVLICVLLAAPLSAVAERMELRAGEHQDFTRVVLAFDALPNWQAGRTDDGYAIVLEGEEPILTDLSRAFALIGRDRLRNIEVDADRRRVDLELDCECYAEIFELNDVRLVIDIREGPSSPNARYELPIDLSTQPRARSAIVMPPLPSLSAPPPVARREIEGGRGDSPVTRMTSPPRLRPVQRRINRQAAVTEPVIDLAEFPVGSLTNFETFLPTIDRLPTVSSPAMEALTQQLGRAAAQGLVEVETRPDRVGQPSESEAVAGPRNFRVFTGFDRDTNRVDQGRSSTSQGMKCIADQFVDILAWGKPEQAKQLGEFRQSILKETGTIDQNAMRDLARYYIVLGFGAEAKFAAEQLPQGQEREILLGLSEIVDKGSSGSPVFDGQIACPGQIALWAAIAKPFTRGELPISTDGILKTFSAWPPHLREHLGPVLSQRLRQAGETALARAALSAVTRIGIGSVGQELTAARLELLGTRATQARTELERLSQGTNTTAAEALLELLQDAARRRVPPKPEWVDDADTLIRVTKGTEIAEKLGVAALRGHIPLGRFDDLRRALTDGGPGLTEKVRTEIASDALSAAVQDADNATFLRTELGLSDFAEPADLDTSSRYDLVRRFLDLGLPDLAFKYLPSDTETAEEVRLAAETYSALDRRAHALTLVGNDDDTSLAEVRARLLTEVRNFEGAAKALEALGDVRGSEIQALRSGDWNWIVEQGPSELSATARTATNTLSTSIAGAGANAELINEVSKRNSAYRELLGRTKPVVQR